MKGESTKIDLGDAFLSAVLGQERVSGVPHEIYRYPARFSPSFAREAILSFTSPGDLVLDPFCGGGTSITEALALGRRAAAMDISSLATFLTRAKTTPLSVHDIREIMNWWTRAKSAWRTSATERSFVSKQYAQSLPPGVSKFFGSILSQLPVLPKIRQQNFVRLVLLSLGQWALDCKINVPTILELETEFHERLSDITYRFRRFLTEAAKSGQVPRCRLTQMRRILGRSSAGCEADRRIPSDWLPAKLVLTSPPYPGVHVLYHRWQIHGRKETAAPFWLANQRDGAGASYYTLGARSEIRLKKYFATLKATFSSIRHLLDANSLVVQLVGFSEPGWQLPAYLEALTNAGFIECLPSCDERFLLQRRIWRRVPGRKWYASQSRGSGREVLLLHKIATSD